MACRSDGSEADAYREMERLTQMLCALLRDLEATGRNEVPIMISAVPGLQEWWQRHKQYDEQRREQERKQKERYALRSVAIGKLTAEERRALGIY